MKKLQGEIPGVDADELVSVESTDLDAGVRRADWNLGRLSLPYPRD